MSNLLNPLPPPDPSATVPPGWYDDPFDPKAWRWWNGTIWTGYSAPRGKKPFLPSWLSWPVVIATPLMLVVLLLSAWGEFEFVLPALVPAALVIPVMTWLDRVEPEPFSSRVHAVLWGAGVATFVSLIINSIVSVAAGTDVGAVVSAPIVEESMKGLGIVWAVRRRELDSMSDGVVFAGLVAIGFAVVEDVLYFVDANSFGVFWQTFVIRAILTPFAHPLFTIWTGLAIGREVVKGRGVNPRVIGGLLAAMATHAAFNGIATYAANADTEAEAGQVLLLGFACFAVLFFAVVVGVIMMRSSERKQFDRLAPMLTARYQLSPVEQGWFQNYQTALRARKSFPRSARPAFDEVRAAIARLAALHERGGSPELERVYASELATGRRSLHEQARPATGGPSAT